jgi:hypothetical protein
MKKCCFLFLFAIGVGLTAATRGLVSTATTRIAAFGGYHRRG